MSDMLDIILLPRVTVRQPSLKSPVERVLGLSMCVFTDYGVGHNIRGIPFALLFRW